MKKTLRLISIILAATVMFSLCACSDKSDDGDEGQNNVNSSAPAVKYSVTLPVAHNDTVDPFKDISSVNRALVPLLYDGLVRIDNSFIAQPLLISNYTNEDKTLTVTLKGGIRFSDGSPITADDVVYSFNQSKRSDYYSARLSGIASASANGNSVEFKLNSADFNVLACLDFPIVKTDTVQTLYGSTKIYDIVPPIGAGRYVINGKLPTATLVPNTYCNRDEVLNIDTIMLFEVNNSEGMSYGLQIGNYDYWYNDLSGGKYTRVNAGLGVVPTNSLVYLGFNDEKSIFTENAVRQALSTLIDRTEIVSQGFQGHATPSALPFNPAWGAMKNVSVTTKMEADVDGAKAILEQAGYTSINHYGYRCSTTQSLTCNLTVCKDNEFKVAAARQIKDQLAKLNFNVRIIELSYDDYVKTINAGEYEMYLGEIMLPANMKITPFFSSSGAANCALRLVDENGLEFTVCYDEYLTVLSGELQLADFCRLFEYEMPFVPVCYRNGVEIYSRNITSDVKGTCYDNFYNIGSWKAKTKTEGNK